jgi:hypothetical protein
MTAVVAVRRTVQHAAHGDRHEQIWLGVDRGGFQSIAHMPMMVSGCPVAIRRAKNATN